MRVLVACEFSGIVRDAFIRKGHDAWSCDILPTESEEKGYHLEGDVMDWIYGTNAWGWDMMIAFPPCTDLARSGGRYFKQKREDGRQKKSIDFFMALARAPISKIVLENPVGIISTHWRKPDQIIQPWMFGHLESKKTCLWLKGLPPLKPTSIVHPPTYLCSCGNKFDYSLGKYGCANCHGEGFAAKLIYDNQTPSGQNKLSSAKSKLRSKTYQGIANAMAQQWG